MTGAALRRCEPKQTTNNTLSKNCQFSVEGLLQDVVPKTVSVKV